MTCSMLHLTVIPLTGFAVSIAIKTIRIRKVKTMPNNTHVKMENNKVKSVTLYTTEILYVDNAGNMVLNNGGYETPTTKRRMNQYLPEHLNVYQEKHKWYVFNSKNNESLPFVSNRVSIPAYWLKD